MKWFYAVFGAVAVIGVGVLGYALRSTLGFNQSGGPVSVPVDIEVLDEPEAFMRMARGVSMGSEDAPITIVEFSDFQCPACAFFAQSVKPRLEETLIDSGRARFVYYDYPLVLIHPNAFLAARAARCAGDQGQFWSYHDELYGNQARWALRPDPVEALGEFAETMGMDTGDFRACLNSDSHAQLVSANLRLAETLGLPGTPAVLIRIEGQDARMVQGFDYESIMAAVNSMTGSEAPGSG